MQDKKKVDNYSILIVAKYLQTPNDFINLVCVCKNFIVLGCPDIDTIFNYSYQSVCGCWQNKVISIRCCIT